MASVSRLFVQTAFLWLLIGMLLGLYMGISDDLSWRSVHLTMMFPAFLVLLAFGVTFGLFADAAAHGLARVQFWLAQAGALVMVIGDVLRHAGQSPVVLAIGSLLPIAAVALLLFILTSRPGAQAAK